MSPGKREGSISTRNLGDNLSKLRARVPTNNWFPPLIVLPQLQVLLC